MTRSQKEIKIIWDRLCNNCKTFEEAYLLELARPLMLAFQIDTNFIKDKSK